MWLGLKPIGHTNKAELNTRYLNVRETQGHLIGLPKINKGIFKDRLLPNTYNF